MATTTYGLYGNGQFPNNLDTGGDQELPSQAAMPGGGYLQVWYSPNGGGSVRGRIYNASGAAPADEFTIATGGAFNPIAITLTNGTILVGYTTGLGAASDVRGMLLSSAGVKSPSDFAINDGASIDILTDIAPLPGGGFVAIYTRTFANNDLDVRGRIFNASGTQVGSDLTISSTDSSKASFQASVTATATGFVVAWREEPAAGGNSAIWMLRFNSEGAAIGSAAVIDATGGINGTPELLTLADGGFVLAYRGDGLSGGGTAHGIPIKIRVFNADGTARSAVYTATPDPDRNYISPSLARVANGGFAFSYYDSTGSLEYLQLFNATGAPLGDRQQFLSGASQGSFATLTNGDVSFGVVTTDDGSGSGIVSFRLTPTRTTTGDGSSEVFVGDGLVDDIHANGGNDVLAGLGGNDTFDGGDGIDVAAYTGTRSSYVLDKSGGLYSITDTRPGSPDGSDKLFRIEKINFNGATTSVETFTPRNFNGDLRSDLAWYNDATGSSVVFLMNGLTSTSGVVVGPANGASWDLVATGDLNGDAQSDMIWQNTSGQVVAYLMNGTSIASAVSVGSPGASFRVVGVGDLNADGNSDIILQDGNGQAVAWLMNGTTIQSAAGIGPANGAAWSIKAVGDLNGDSRADLVWQNTDGSTVGYIMNGGSIVAANQIGGALGANWSVKGMGDMNGDFAADIIWQYSNGQAGVWLMNGTSIAAAQGIGGANGSQFEIRDIADLNGDARMDLVWENMSTGQAVGFLDRPPSSGPFGMLV